MMFFLALNLEKNHIFYCLNRLSSLYSLYYTFHLVVVNDVMLNRQFGHY